MSYILYPNLVSNMPNNVALTIIPYVPNVSYIISIM